MCVRRRRRRRKKQQQQQQQQPTSREDHNLQVTPQNRRCCWWPSPRWLESWFFSVGGQKSRMQQHQQQQQHLSIENRSRWNASTVSEAEDEVESLMKTSDYCFLFRRKGGSLNRRLHINSWVIVFRFSTKGLPQQTFIVGSGLAKGFLELGWLWSACWHDSLDDVGPRQTRALW